MIAAHDIAAVRRAEAAVMSGPDDDTLMQRAASGLATVVAEVLRRRAGGVYGRRVVLLVGPGANGGDALWAGARLASRGAAVTALLATGRAHERGAAGLRAAGGTVVEATADDGAAHGLLDRADVVVDGLLGIGGRPGLTSTAALLVERIPPGVPVVAVDVPSGVDPDTGELDGPAVRADVTVTFGTAKPSLLLPPGDALAGDVRVVDIGLGGAELGAPEVERLEADDVPRLWPVPARHDDKYSRGVVGVVAGGAAYTGAAVLCTGAAVRAGAGMVRYVGPEPASDLVRARWPEVVPGEGRVQAWVLGPGVDARDDAQADAVRTALAQGLPCVVDAGGLDVLAGMLLTGERPSGPLLLTPHAGELARLLAVLPADVDPPAATTRYDGLTREAVVERPLHYTRLAAELTGATVLLKGATTLVAEPGLPVRSQPGGTPWLATAGSGDVLAGIAGVLLAGGLPPRDAGSLAVIAHGAAGRLASAGGPLSAGTLLDAVAPALTALLAPASAPTRPDGPPRGTPTASPPRRP